MADTIEERHGTRSMAIFTDAGNRKLYVDLMREQPAPWGLRALAWRLMSNAEATRPTSLAL